MTTIGIGSLGFYGHPKMSVVTVILVVLSLFLPRFESSSLKDPGNIKLDGVPATEIPISTSVDTCQCGVFLLGASSLIFSSDAKPILSGHPVSANCSAKADRESCAKICRQLIQAMSDGPENSPLVQTVVLAATRTLACQKFNESEKVPLPRTISGNPARTFVKLDQAEKRWNFYVRPSARRDTSKEQLRNDGDEVTQNSVMSTFAPEKHLDESGNIKKEFLTQPKWLGGFYRWCDEQWVYAGVSLNEPLCCYKHLPQKCPGNQGRSMGGGKRQPRLIIRPRPADDTSDESIDLDAIQEIDISENFEHLSSKPLKMTEDDEMYIEDDEMEADLPAGLKDTNGINNEDEETVSLETLNPFETTSRPIKHRKPLNSTVVAEAFKFAGSLMESLGYGDVVKGITTILPASTASELLERVDVGGWVSGYQDRYVQWPREFSLGYCYLEYGLYNAASEGIVSAATNFISRVFKPSSSSPNPIITNPNRSNMPGQGIPDMTGVSSIPAYSNMPLPPMPPQPNYIQGMGDASYSPYVLQGNRRFKRSPGVTVSRAYTSPSSDNSKPSNTPSARRVSGTSSFKYTYPFQSSIDADQLGNSQAYTTGRSIPTTITTTPAPVVTTAAPYDQPSHNSYSYHVPHQGYETEPQYYDGSYKHYDYRYADDLEMSASKPTDYLRTRRHPRPPYPEIHYPPSSRIHAPEPMEKPKEGSNGGNLMNIASILMQSAMAGNGDSGGNGGGEQVASLVQNALPIVSQVASSPMVQGMVNNLVTSFLTPPHRKPPRPSSTSDPVIEDDEDEDLEDVIKQVTSKPSYGSKPSINDPLKSNVISDDLDVNYLDDKPSGTDSNNGGQTGSGSRPDNGGGLVSLLGAGGGSTLTSLVSKMVQTYLNFMFSDPEPKNPSKISSKPSKKPNKKKNKEKISNEETVEGDGDIVEAISRVAKPFFISYFGVVPDEPGFGKLRISSRLDRYRFKNPIEKDGSKHSTEILTNDPDVGTGISEVIFGSVNIPETGNPLFDFGNRVVYGFSKSNDPTHGLYCFKQYSVNKMWDYFRTGVRAFFKK